ncbi:MAG: hypothetical protein QJR13_00055 [Bacillota bacterium]|nr:hypothetical protein [Bacillota bacterium]
MGIPWGDGLLLFRDGFRRDVAVAVLLTILLGIAVAAGVAWATDAYFGETVTGLLGEAGEYDLIVQVREEAKGAARAEMGRVLRQLPGAKVKEGLAIAGKVNFFVALPAELRTRRVFESIGTYFNGLPGYAGYTFIIEPSLTVRGVPAGAQPLLLPQIEDLPGVDFAFRHGESITAVLKDAGATSSVNASLRRLLRRYQVVEVRLPLGYQTEDLPALSERIVNRLRDQFHPRTAVDITGGEGGDDFQAFVSTLAEVRRFLEGYASRVTVRLQGWEPLRPGDEVVAQGSSSVPPVVGERVRSDHLRVRIQAVEGQTARGLVVEGDPAPYLQSGAGLDQAALTAYRVVKGDEIGPQVGLIRVENERWRIIRNLEESLRMVEQLHGLAAEARGASEEVLAALEAYDRTREELRQAQEVLQQVNAGLEGPLAQIRQSDVDRLVAELNRVSTSIGSLISQVEGVGAAPAPGQSELSSVLNRLNPVVQILAGFRKQIDLFVVELQGFSRLSRSTGVVRELLGQMEQAAGSTLEAMQGVDTATLRLQLTSVLERLEALEQLDVAALKAQLEEIKAALPDLRDEEIGRSVRLIDQYIGGETLPGQSLSLLLDRDLEPAALKAAIGREVKSDRVSLFALPVGSVEPDVRGTVLHLLNSVRGTIAGLVALVFTFLVLLLDHSTVISALRRLSERRCRGANRRWWQWRPDASWLYGPLAGAAIFTGVYLGSGGRLPLLPAWGAVPVGLALGLLTSLLAERVSPVRDEQILAGEAVGLTYAQVMREIVIPAGRPGILQWLNRRRQKFK